MKDPRSKEIDSILKKGRCQMNDLFDDGKERIIDCGPADYTDSLVFSIIIRNEKDLKVVSRIFDLFYLFNSDVCRRSLDINIFEHLDWNRENYQRYGFDDDDQRYRFTFSGNDDYSRVSFVFSGDAFRFPEDYINIVKIEAFCNLVRYKLDSLFSASAEDFYSSIKERFKDSPVFAVEFKHPW